jgi:polyene glycosyltransferase
VDCYDQAVRAEDLGFGLRLDKPRAIDPDDVVDKLTRVLEEPSFTERAQRMSALQRAADLILELPALRYEGERGLHVV